MKKQTLIAFTTAGVSFMTAYNAYIDSKKDKSKVIPSLIMLAMSGYLTYIQFSSARKEYLIASTSKKLGNISIKHQAIT